jgi:hypothetical protein
MRPWHAGFTIGWLVFFGVFMGLDILAWLSHSPRIPTFSRVFVHAIPDWVGIPAAIILLLHFVLMYSKKS